MTQTHKHYECHDPRHLLSRNAVANATSENTSRCVCDQASFSVKDVTSTVQHRRSLTDSENGMTSTEEQSEKPQDRGIPFYSGLIRPFFPRPSKLVIKAYPTLAPPSSPTDLYATENMTVSGHPETSKSESSEELYRSLRIDRVLKTFPKEAPTDNVDDDDDSQGNKDESNENDEYDGDSMDSRGCNEGLDKKEYSSIGINSDAYDEDEEDDDDDDEDVEDDEGDEDDDDEIDEDHVKYEPNEHDEDGKFYEDIELEEDDELEDGILDWDLVKRRVGL